MNTAEERVAEVKQILTNAWDNFHSDTRTESIEGIIMFLGEILDNIELTLGMQVADE